MKNLETELDVLIGKEGSYSNDPKDSGGATNWGITEFVARSFGYTGDMKDLPKGTAKEIYRQRYWVQPKFDKVFDISPEIAGELFDTGVNMGVATGSKFLQRALNVLNQEAKLFPNMTVDGSIGNMTLSSLKIYIDKRGTDGVKVLLRLLNAFQAVRYVEICEGKETQENFLYGWVLNRVE